VSVVSVELFIITLFTCVKKNAKRNGSPSVGCRRRCGDLAARYSKRVLRRISERKAGEVINSRSSPAEAHQQRLAE
jgi:hypothetical protein